MRERINWIDWAKAIAVTAVVFCHLPQSQEWFYFRYLQACTITVFFFLSGYLKKDRGSDRENWRKYWRGLILPYLLWNAIVYPYWLLRYTMLNGGLPDIIQAMRPVVGALLFEHENAFAIPLNGPLWYLPAVLFMHVIVDLCRKTKHQHVIMIALCIISYLFYVACKYWALCPNLTPMGIIRRLPYYYLGYVMAEYQLFKYAKPKRDIVCGIICFLGSLFLFGWHLHETNSIIHTALFYPINLGFLFGVLYGCKLIDRYKSDIIVNLSVGTLVIIGFHNVFIGAFNYIIEQFFRQTTDICYQWYEALPLTLMIVALLYPAIIYGKKHTPYLLGK